MTIAALAAGKHVLCEKPMATTSRDCEEMRAAAERSDRVLLLGLQLRYASRYRELQALVEGGRIGRPRYMSFVELRGDWNNSNVWLYRDPASGREMNWRFSQTASGGALNEKVCHYFDILNWLAGAAPERVSAQGGLNCYSGRETWDHATTSLSTRAGSAHAIRSACTGRTGSICRSSATRARCT